MKRYESEAVDVTFDVRRCIHAAECVRGLPGVFDPERRPWIDPSAADPDALAAVVARCPTGALHALRKSGAPREVPAANEISAGPNGPLYLRGRVVVENNDGAQILRDTRVALCRCGASKNKPLCDGAHVDAAFEAPGCEVTSAGATEPDPEELAVSVVPDGPLLLTGPYRLVTVDGDREERSGGAFCRCGASSRKPFCDGSHTAIGFQAE